MARRKTTRGGGDDDGPTYLAPGYPVAAVEAALGDRIVKGRQLLGRIDIHAFPQPGRVDELKQKYWAWFNYNATYLERAFTTKELRVEFEGILFGSGGPESDLDRIRELARDLQRDIGKLVDIQGRLALYDRPGQQQAAAAPPLHRPGAANRPPINVTIEHVGQLNLAELIERVDARIKQVDQRGEGDLAAALKTLADAIEAAGEAAADQRDEALDAVAVLAEVGARPAEERPKLRGRVRAAISVIANLAEIAPVVKATWEAMGPAIMEHLPRLS